VLFTHSLANLQNTAEYFGRNPYAPSEPPEPPAAPAPPATAAAASTPVESVAADVNGAPG
jgi:hypothetical protein